ncbi:uncharacterized protein HMPREF1541_06340 [Cyphellophora europaea CBS 101466]|uniref:DUF3328 domain-containing protein n=1 Tax=Cyphellophora europaea (strain CBS 101466) TaxID=1220924 RepID=W2RRF3_CYPE1|nr:uncharacterized protein HMPREF1541_06340 [Cyphellophora europaea CBS 101466]ETN38309.1 hypothetical protein HMPREF1541_06340 [Cyphellophora europaea CBS 101466]
MSSSRSTRPFTPFILLGGTIVGFCAITYLFLSFSDTHFVHIFSSKQHRAREWSPIPRYVSLEQSTQVFNGSFQQKTIYRQPPSPETDQAWHDLGIMYGPVLIAEDDASTFGISQDHYSVSDGQSSHAYPAHVEVLHQLHCLNLLRKSLFFNADYYRQQQHEEFVNEGEILETHITHCLDIIRQRLMCTADVGLVPYFPVIHADGRHSTTPDFSRPHSCRNFDAIRRWGEEHKHDELGHQEHG